MGSWGEPIFGKGRRKIANLSTSLLQRVEAHEFLQTLHLAYGFKVNKLLGKFKGRYQRIRKRNDIRRLALETCQNGVWGVLLDRQGLNSLLCRLFENRRFEKAKG